MKRATTSKEKARDRGRERSSEMLGFRYLSDEKLQGLSHYKVRGTRLGVARSKTKNHKLYKPHIVLTSGAHTSMP